VAQASACGIRDGESAVSSSRARSGHSERRRARIFIAANPPTVIPGPVTAAVRLELQQFAHLRRFPLGLSSQKLANCHSERSEESAFAFVAPGGGRSFAPFANRACFAHSFCRGTAFYPESPHEGQPCRKSADWFCQGTASAVPQEAEKLAASAAEGRLAEHGSRITAYESRSQLDFGPDTFYCYAEPRPYA